MGVRAQLMLSLLGYMLIDDDPVVAKSYPFPCALRAVPEITKKIVSGKL